MFNELKMRFFDLMEQHPGKSIGLFAGLLIGVLVLSIGFFKTLFLIGCLSVGLLVGTKYDDDKSAFMQRIKDIKLPNRLKRKL